MISRKTRQTAFGVLSAAIGIVAVMVYLALSVAPPVPENATSNASRKGDQFGSSQTAASSTGPEIGEKVARADRSIAPELITLPPQVTGPLIRIEGIKPSVPERPPPPKTVTLRPVKVLDAGALRNRELTVLLARIQPIGLDNLCTTENGDEWPCGRHARTALRRLIRGRSVICWRTDGGAFDGNLVKAECRIGKRNVSNWLVEQGWARLTSTSDEMDNRLEIAAREAKRGQWRGTVHSVGAPATQPNVLTLDFNREDLNLPTLDAPPFDLPDNTETSTDTLNVDGLGIDSADATGPIADLPFANGLLIDPDPNPSP